MAFALLLLIPYAGMKLIAGRLGERSRKSVLGPIDRVLGFGFGAVKGAIIVVMAFSLLVLRLRSRCWGISGRPPGSSMRGPIRWSTPAPTRWSR